MAVVREYAEAWRDGDARRFLSLVHAQDARQRRALEAFAEVIATTPKLRHAAARKYGADDAEAIVAHIVPPTDRSGIQMLEYLDDATSSMDIEMAGDRATVGLEPVGKVELLRVAGRWKVVLEDPGEIDQQQVELFRRLATAQRQLGKDIEAGKHATAEQAMRALLAEHPRDDAN